jgi:hypothetical protein
MTKLCAARQLLKIKRNRTAVPITHKLGYLEESLILDLPTALSMEIQCSQSIKGLVQLNPYIYGLLFTYLFIY